MPCNDGPTAADYASANASDAIRKVRFLEALLCGLIKASGGGEMYDHNMRVLFSKIDWKAAGVTEREAINWWKNHLEEDKTKP
jgi:hypothetical protein